VIVAELETDAELVSVEEGLLVCERSDLGAARAAARMRERQKIEGGRRAVGPQMHWCKSAPKRGAWSTRRPLKLRRHGGTVIQLPSASAGVSRANAINNQSKPRTCVLVAVSLVVAVIEALRPSL